MVPKRDQGLGRVHPIFLVLDRFLPLWVRQDVLDGLHIRYRVLEKAIEVCKVPDWSELPHLLLQCAVEDSWSDELDIIVKQCGQAKKT